MVDHPAPFPPPWERAHAEACAKHHDTYDDPETGRIVFTADYLRRRGYCCKSGCRHCPYGFRRDSPQ